jgi:hypothetical protein
MNSGKASILKFKNVSSDKGHIKSIDTNSKHRCQSSYNTLTTIEREREREYDLGWCFTLVYKQELFN